MPSSAQVTWPQACVCAASNSDRCRSRSTKRTGLSRVGTTSERGRIMCVTGWMTIGVCQKFDKCWLIILKQTPGFCLHSFHQKHGENNDKRRKYPLAPRCPSDQSGRHCPRRIAFFPPDPRTTVSVAESGVQPFLCGTRPADDDVLPR